VSGDVLGLYTVCSTSGNWEKMKTVKEEEVTVRDHEKD
jgi:hypothetical protein